ncbi:ion transporter [Lishizhenia tianjinensis]|uniref:ion transporter n=1 Tax=Lishizhenia tianjinensis TaxID=477690 RepID=UPI001FCD0AE0|nr:ion transporter [Lishizhenia tianjinensis]
MRDKKKPATSDWRAKVHEVIYEADTRAGKNFDIILLVAILLSVLVVMLESVTWINEELSWFFQPLEWVLTVLFTLEYILRIVCIRKPWSYIFSFYGIIDLLSLLPTYISLFFTGTHSLAVIRSIRLLRVFRIFKLAQFLSEATTIMKALRNSRYKISVFMLGVLMIVIIMGTVMYLVEGGPDSNFDSIPRSIYWAIITLTTVGYGDISPVTALGQAISSIVMIFGYAILAVPTGIVTNEFIKSAGDKSNNTQACPNCSLEGHDDDAKFCKFCGSEL